MAQTIALQRGTGTVGGTNNSSTLFTQSGGISTRVIFNQLALYNPYGSNWSYPGAYLVHNVSNGSSNIIAWAINSGGGGFQFYINSNSTGQIIGNSLNYPGSNTETNSWGFNYQANSGSFSGFSPQNFWIGPSDSLAIRFFSNNGYGATYAYHFTTITES
jgi:hypothetical protein